MQSCVGVRTFSGSEKIAREVATKPAMTRRSSALRQDSGARGLVSAVRESLGFGSESPWGVRTAQTGNETAQFFVVAEHMLQARENIVGHVSAGCFPCPDAGGLDVQFPAHLIGCRSGADHPHGLELLEAQ